MEKAKPERPEPAPEVRDDPRVVAHRCPFCHEAVRPEAEAWVACAQCLGRQHATCWDEAGRCGACRHDQRLEAPARTPAGRQRPLLLAALPLSALTVAAGLAVAVFFASVEQAPPSAWDVDVSALEAEGVVSGGGSSPQTVTTFTLEPASERVAEPAPAVEAADSRTDELRRRRAEELARASSIERQRLLAAEDIEGRRFEAPRAPQRPFTWIPEGAAATDAARRLVQQHRERALEREGEVSSLVLLAHANVYAGNLEQAVIDCDRALDRDPRHGPAWTVRGWARLGLGDLEGADLDLRRGERLSDDPTWAMIGLGRVAERSGRRAEAVGFYRAGLQLGGDHLVVPFDHASELRREIERLERP